MTNLSDSEKRYVDSLKDVLESNLLHRAFLQYFGRPFDSQIKGREKEMKFYVYQPGDDLIQNLVQNQSRQSVLFRLTFLSEFLSCFHIETNEEVLKKIIEQNDFSNDVLLTTVFGSFLNHFDRAHYRSISLFSYYQLSLEEQKKIRTVLYSSRIPEVLSNHFLIEGFHILEKAEKEFYHLLDEISLSDFLLQNYRSLPSQKNASILAHFSNFSFSAIFLTKSVLRGLSSTSRGCHVATSKGNHIFVSIYSSLNVLFHEFGHQLLNESLCTSHDSSFLSFGYDPIWLRQGIFNDDDEQEVLALEAFNDYFVSQAMNSLKSGDYAIWPYSIYEESVYSEMSFLVEQFLDSFDYLMKYAMLNHQPHLVRTVLGSDHFDAYLALFSKYQMMEKTKKQMEAIQLELRIILDAMIEHAKSYSPSYYDEVHAYLQSLESSGKHVRVLRPSMEKLKKDECVIQATIDHLF